MARERDPGHVSLGQLKSFGRGPSILIIFVDHIFVTFKERLFGNQSRSILPAIEWFSFECRKTKTKVITLANHIGHRQYIEPIKTRSNYMWLTQSAGKSCERVTIGFGFTSDWMKRWRESFKPIASCRKCKTNYFSTLK